MGPELILGLGLVILAGFWIFEWHYERQAGDTAEHLVGQVNRALSGFDISLEHDASAGRKRRERKNRRRRHRGKGDAASD